MGEAKSKPGSQYTRPERVGAVSAPGPQRGKLQTQEEQVSQQTRTKPLVFYGWFIVAAGMGMHLWVSICWVYGMQVFFTPIVQTFGWSRAIVSGAFGLQRLEGSIVAPIEGFLVDKYGPRKMVLAGAVIMGASVMYLSVVNSIFMFYIAVLLVSLGTSATGTPRNWAIVQWFQRQRGRAFGNRGLRRNPERPHALCRGVAGGELWMAGWPSLCWASQPGA